MKQLSETGKEMDARLRQTEEELNRLLLSTPNFPDPCVPQGTDSGENVEQRRWETPREFAFSARPHWELGEALGILDPVSAAKVSGARFHFYKGLGAALERAVIRQAHPGRRLYRAAAAFYGEPRFHDGNRPASQI